MKTKLILMGICFLLLVFIPGFLMAAENITNFDSTQPRGFGGPQDQFDPNACSQGPVYNDQGQNLCPIVDGLWSPQFHASVGGQEGEFEEWKGMMMGNAARDPAFFATLSVANQDFINLVYAAVQYGIDDYNPDLDALVGIGTAREVACALKIYEPAFPDPCVPGNDISLLH